MNQNKRYFLSRLVIGVLLVGLSSTQAWLPQAFGESSDPALDGVAYDRIRLLRDELAVTNRDLAAMGLDQAQAQGVLGQLKGWYFTNRAALDQVERSQRQTKQALRETMRLIHVGPRDDLLVSQVSNLKQQLASYRQQQKDLLDAAASSLTSTFTSDQRQVWETAHTNTQANAPQRYRYAPGLSEKQIADMRGSDGPLDSGSPSDLLTLDQKQALDQAHQRVRQHVSGVQKAETQVLPMPPELVELRDAAEEIPNGIAEQP